MMMGKAAGIALLAATPFGLLVLSGAPLRDGPRATAHYAVALVRQRSDTPHRLAWHQSQGHQVVLFSASLGPYLRPLGRLLGVDGVLCTDAVVDADGRYSGELAGANCRGPEKARLLREWLRQRGIDNAELWAYGDSVGDRELLSLAHHHVYVKGKVVTSEPSSTEQGLPT